MVFSIITGALSAFSRSQMALLDRALGLGEMFDTAVSESLGLLGEWVQPPEVPKPFYGRDDGTFESFFKSRLRYLYLVFFLSLGMLCLFHFMYRGRKNDKWNTSNGNPGARSPIGETNEKGVQTLCSSPEGSVLSQMITKYDVYTTGLRQRLSRMRMTQTSHVEDKKELPSLAYSAPSSPPAMRKARKSSTATKPQSGIESSHAKTSHKVCHASKHKSILLSRNVRYTIKKAKPKAESQSPQWAGNNLNKFKKILKPIDTIPYIIKKSPKKSTTVDRPKKSAKRKKSKSSPTKEVTNCQKLTKHTKSKPRKLMKKAFSPDKNPQSKMKTKLDITKQQPVRDSKRCKTCKKIRPFNENQTPDFTPMFDPRPQGHANSLFCFNPVEKFESMYSRTKLNDQTRGSAVGDVLRGSRTCNLDMKSTGEDTNMNKTLLRQEAEKIGPSVYHSNLPKLMSSNKLLLSTTSANQSIHNVLLNSHHDYSDSPEHRRHSDNQAGRRDGGDGYTRQQMADGFDHNGTYPDVTNGGHHVSRYDNHQRQRAGYDYIRNIPTDYNLQQMAKSSNVHTGHAFKPIYARVEDEIKQDNSQNYDKQSLAKIASTGLVGDNMHLNNTSHQTISHNIFSRRLLQRRNPLNKKNISNMGRLEKYGDKDLRGNENIGISENFQGRPTPLQKVHEMKLDVCYPEQHQLNIPMLPQNPFVDQQMELSNKRFVKIKSNKWRLRPKPYTKTNTSKNTAGLNSPVTSEKTYTLISDTSNTLKSHGAIKGCHLAQDGSSPENGSSLNLFEKPNHCTNTVNHLNSEQNSSSVTSHLNKNNCSPSRLKKSTMKNWFAKHDTQPEEIQMSTRRNGEKSDKAIETDGNIEEQCLDVANKTDGNSVHFNKNSSTITCNKMTSTHTLKIPNLDSHTSMTRKPSPLRRIQRKLSLSASRKSLKYFHSPVSKSMACKPKVDKQTPATSRGVSWEFDEGTRENLLCENTVSLGIQTSATSLRNISVQTSPPQAPAPLTNYNQEIRIEPSGNDAKLQVGSGSDNDDDQNLKTKIPADESFHKPKPALTDRNKTARCEDKGSTPLAQEHYSNKASNPFLQDYNIPLTSKKIQKCIPVDCPENNFPRAFGDVIDTSSQSFRVRRLSLQPRSSSCSRTTDRMSSCDSSPISVLMDSHAWMERPRWEDANIDEVNRRVERALKLRKQLQKCKEGRLESPVGRYQRCDPITKSSSCIDEKQKHPDADIDTPSSQLRRTVQDGNRMMSQTTYGKENLKSRGSEQEAKADVILEEEQDSQNGTTYFNNQNTARVSNVQSRTKKQNVHCTNPNSEIDFSTPDYSNSNRISLLSAGQNLPDESETTDTLGKTLPFNTDHADSELLHPLSSVFGSTRQENTSLKFRNDKQSSNLSPPNSSILKGADGGKMLEQCQSYHGDLHQDLISAVRVRPASTASFSRRAEESANEQELLTNTENWQMGEGPNKNSPPIKISRMENAIQSEYPRLVGELVQALPHVPLASFVEWFIETSHPGQFTGSEASASPEVNKIHIKTKHVSSSDCTDYESKPVTQIDITPRRNSRNSEILSDVAHAQNTEEFNTLLDCDNVASLMCESPESNIIYDTDNACENQTSQANDIDNKQMQSIRRIWLTRKGANLDSSSDAVSDKERQKIICFKKNMLSTGTATSKTGSLFMKR